MKRSTRFHKAALATLASLLFASAGTASTAADDPGAEQPRLTLSGSLYDGRGTTLAEGVYRLEILAEGGVESVALLVNGFEEDYWERPCDSPGCTMRETFLYDTYEWSPDEQVITVVATDFHGHAITSEQIRVAYAGDPDDPGYEAPEYTEDDVEDDPDPYAPGCGPMNPAPISPAPAERSTDVLIVCVGPGAVPARGEDLGSQSGADNEVARLTAGDEEPIDAEESIGQAAPDEQARGEGDADDIAADGAATAPARAAEAPDPPTAPYGRDELAPAASMR